MRKQFLHLSVYLCNNCSGPVVAGSVAVRENEISRETGFKDVGAICLSCGRRPDQEIEPAQIRHFPPVGWDPSGTIDSRSLTNAYVKALDRVPVH